MSDTEADTCRKYVVPKLYSAGWKDEQIAEQRTFTDGRIVVTAGNVRRKKQKRADYLLRYTRDFMIAVVEAKDALKEPGDGIQQAKEYAEILGLKFAYSTNGKGILEHDFITGQETEMDSFPSPDDLWKRIRGAQGITDQVAERLLTPFHLIQGKTPRYYQEIAINRAVQSVLQEKRRILLTMATGTGKTFVSFQVIWKLWSSRWNRTGEYRKPKILYLADRNILVDGPKDKEFSLFENARHKIAGEVVKGREIYFAIYQAIAKDERRPGLYREYPRDFFDLIVVDECHRGSARDESNWREILEYFEPAYQLGMTATPLREENRDTYRYFGSPIYTYSLKQGIEDGFLAPYQVHRVITSVDAAGWRPSAGELDRYGRPIPDELYETQDFETIVSLKARTEAFAKHLTDYLKKTDRFAKTIIFCVDQEHAEEMRRALNNFNADLVQQHPDYVVRIVADEGSTGRGYLDRFSELETTTPTLVTTSRLLTTGVDIPTCKNVVIARVIKSMTEFKQIIGRGSRVRTDYGKYYFTILDYTGSATRLFADPDFDGEPVSIAEEKIDSSGNSTGQIFETPPPSIEEETHEPPETTTCIFDPEDGTEQRRKFYVDGGSVEVVANMVYEMDAEGNQLRVVEYRQYTANKLCSMFTSAADLRSKWTGAEERDHLLAALKERGIALEKLAEITGKPDADPFDLLCHVAFNQPLKTRRERVQFLRKNKSDFFKHYGEEARRILDEILDKYIEHGVEEFKIPDTLKVPPISRHGNVMEIGRLFGGADQLRQAVVEMQAHLYNA